LLNKILQEFSKVGLFHEQNQNGNTISIVLVR
jgi:hypothetical protein